MSEFKQTGFLMLDLRTARRKLAASLRSCSSCMKLWNGKMPVAIGGHLRGMAKGHVFYAESVGVIDRKQEQKLGNWIDSWRKYEVQSCKGTGSVLAFLDELGEINFGETCFAEVETLCPVCGGLNCEVQRMLDKIFHPDKTHEQCCEERAQPYLELSPDHGWAVHEEKEVKEMRRIAVRYKSKVVAFALVDNRNYLRVKAFRWNLHNCGYAEARMRVDGRSKKVLLHRFVFNAKKNELVDHKNRNKRDCRSKNLRLSNKSLNMLNGDKFRKNATSKHRGVSFNTEKRKWLAQSKINRKYVFLGYHKTEIQAKRAYSSFIRSVFRVA